MPTALTWCTRLIFLSSADGSNTEPPTPFSFHCYCRSHLLLESMAGWQSSLTRASQKMVVREGSPLAVTQDTCAHALTTLCRHSPQLRGPSHAPAERRVQIEDRGAGSYLWLEEERWAHAVPIRKSQGSFCNVSRGGKVWFFKLCSVTLAFYLNLEEHPRWGGGGEDDCGDLSWFVFLSCQTRR